MQIILLGREAPFAGAEVCGKPLRAYVEGYLADVPGPDTHLLYVMADAAFLPAGALAKLPKPGAVTHLRKAALALPRELADPEYRSVESVAKLIEKLTAQGLAPQSVPIRKAHCRRVKDLARLAEAEALVRRHINEALMRGGVRMLDPLTTYVDAGVKVGEGTVIHPGCTLAGKTTIGRGCTLRPHCRLQDAAVADGVTIESSVLLECTVGEGAQIGPFAYLRPGSSIGPRCRVGDFVEIKNSSLGADTKVSHLTYVGDSDLGEGINLGCGVVFVNYDGKRKERSKVGDHAFIGCNVNLIAPVQVGEDAYIAAGSTITEDVPAGAFSIGRSRQTTKEGWVARRREQGKL